MSNKDPKNPEHMVGGGNTGATDEKATIRNAIHTNKEHNTQRQTLKPCCHVRW